LEGARDVALALGARPATVNWRVLIDPADHPFCLTTLVQEI
jgi:hypothetical protein